MFINFLEASPIGKERDEGKYKTFENLVLGYPYKAMSKSLSSKNIMQNTRGYEIGTVPNSLSIQDGNGKIMMLTMGIDIGGREDDA